MLTTQDLLNSAVEKIMAQEKAYQQYRAIGRDTSKIELNMLTLYNGLSSWPYVTTADQIQAFQGVLVQITLPA